jgi:hypothetical protein
LLNNIMHLKLLWLAGFFLPTDRTEPARSGTGLPVRFGREPVGNRTNSNLNSNHVVQSGPTGIPTGLIGIPDRFDRFPVVETKKPNYCRILTWFQIWIKKWNNKRKFSKNIARCIESNGDKTFQILLHLVFFAGY